MHFELDGAGLIPSEEDSPHFPPQPTPDCHPVNKNLFGAKGLSLTKGLQLTTSRSDPHLNLTHLFHQENQVKEALNGLLIGHDLGQDESPIHFMGEHPLVQQLKGGSLAPSSSSALLDPTSASASAPTLRKSSSALDWSFINEVGKDSHIHHLADRPTGGILDPNRKKSITHYGIPALALLGSGGCAHKEDHDGGLTMTIPSSTTSLSNTQSSSSTTSSGMFGTLSTTSGPSSSSSSHPLVAAATAVLHGPATVNPLHQSASSGGLEAAKLGEQQAAAAAADHKGLFGSVFNRGFLGRPVLRTDEENYRYIMALDR